MRAVWDFLVHNGLYAAVILTVVGAATTWTLRLILRELRVIVALLDTHLPGGLRDVLDVLEGKAHDQRAGGTHG